MASNGDTGETCFWEAQSVMQSIPSPKYHIFIAFAFTYQLLTRN